MSSLVNLLLSPHISLRRASLSCLRQLSQREAREVCEMAMSHVASLGVKDTHSVDGIMAYSDSGLPGILFSLLDQVIITIMMMMMDKMMIMMMIRRRTSTW